MHINTECGALSAHEPTGAETKLGWGCSCVPRGSLGACTPSDPSNGCKAFECGSKETLCEVAKQLAMECDSRHAHEDALEEQVRALGGQPVRFTWLDPDPTEM